MVALPTCVCASSGKRPILRPMQNVDARVSVQVLRNVQGGVAQPKEVVAAAARLLAGQRGFIQTTIGAQALPRRVTTVPWVHIEDDLTKFRAQAHVAALSAA